MGGGGWAGRFLIPSARRGIEPGPVMLLFPPRRNRGSVSFPSRPTRIPRSCFQIPYPTLKMRTAWPQRPTAKRLAAAQHPAGGARRFASSGLDRRSAKITQRRAKTWSPGIPGVRVRAIRQRVMARAGCYARRPAVRSWGCTLERLRESRHRRVARPARTLQRRERRFPPGTPGLRWAGRTPDHREPVGV